LLLRQSRNQIVVAGRLPPRFQDIALWDTGTIVFAHLGWASKTFRAVALDINPDGSIDGVFAEEQSTDWDDVATGTYNNVSNGLVPATNVTKPSIPRNFAVAQNVNGTLRFTWDVPIVNPRNTLVRIIRSTNSGDASVGTTIHIGATQPVVLVQPNSLHWYWAQAFAPGSRYGPYSPNTFGVGAYTRLEADQTLQMRLSGDAEFEYGAISSLWETGPYVNHGNVSFGLTTGLGDSNMQLLIMARQETAPADLYTFTYNASGGQYGGYMNYRQHATQSNSGGAFFGMLLASNPLKLGSGTAYNGDPFGVEFEARVRVNSFNFSATQQFEFGIMSIYDAPNSPGMQQWSARCSVYSFATLRLGEWSVVRGFGVVLPPAVRVAVGSTAPAAVRSFQSAYMRAGILFNTVGSRGNFDIDLFQATAIGWRNEPVHYAEIQGDGFNTRQLQLFEFMSMNALILNVLSGTSIVFPASTDYKHSDWRQWTIGRRLEMSKTSTLLSAYLNPSSGMTLKLAGRAATGTITFVTSLPGFGVLEKTGPTEFTMYATNGNGLI
jgi:hypothetical protein